jgi:hypothetical protein
MPGNATYLRVSVTSNSAQFMKRENSRFKEIAATQVDIQK